MIIKKPKPKKNFAQFENDIIGIKSKPLSMKANMILLYLLSKPSDWIPNIEDIYNSFSDGYNSITSALTELRLNGFADILQKRNDKGRIVGQEYIIYGSPELKEKYHLDNPTLTFYQEVQKKEKKSDHLFEKRTMSGDRETIDRETIDRETIDRENMATNKTKRSNTEKNNKEGRKTDNIICEI